MFAAVVNRHAVGAMPANVSPSTVATSAPGSTLIRIGVANGSGAGGSIVIVVAADAREPRRVGVDVDALHDRAGGRVAHRHGARAERHRLAEREREVAGDREGGAVGGGASAGRRRAAGLAVQLVERLVVQVGVAVAVVVADEEMRRARSRAPPA